MSTENIKTTPSKKPKNESINTHKEVVDGTGELKGKGVDFGMTSGTSLFSVIHMEQSRKEEVNASNFEGAVTQNVVEVIKMVFNLTTKA